MIIAIDGPSGAGKSTLGKKLAKELGLLYLDTGAMYRAVAVAALNKDVDFVDHEGLTQIANDARIELVGEPDFLHIFLDGVDITSEIRTLEVDHQRQIGNSAANGCVLEGRDIGSVVFPNANFKFFLTAKPEARARRRYEEDKSKGLTSTYEQTLAEINQRDQRDVSRTDSPLVIADDAIVIDTSELDLREVFEQMIAVVREKSNAAS
jgi:cytidylate kinase